MQTARRSKSAPRSARTGHSGARQVASVTRRGTSVTRQRPSVALGIATHLGWAAVVAVAPTAELLRVVANRRIETARPSDVVAAAPYHRAAGYEGAKRIPAPRDPKAVLERALARQRRHTLERSARCSPTSPPTAMR